MSQYFKKRIIKTWGYALYFLFLPTLVFAGNDYVPISPGGELPFSDGSTDFPGVLEGLFKGGVTLAALLAVTMLIVGGVEYMGSDSIFAKDQGKKRIMSALGGLLIALCSVLILGLIFGFGSGNTFEIDID